MNAKEFAEIQPILQEIAASAAQVEQQNPDPAGIGAAGVGDLNAMVQLGKDFNHPAALGTAVTAQMYNLTGSILQTSS